LRGAVWRKRTWTLPPALPSGAPVYLRVARFRSFKASRRRFFAFLNAIHDGMRETSGESANRYPEIGIIVLCDEAGAARKYRKYRLTLKISIFSKWVIRIQRLPNRCRVTFVRVACSSFLIKSIQICIFRRASHVAKSGIRAAPIRGRGFPFAERSEYATSNYENFQTRVKIHARHFVPSEILRGVWRRVHRVRDRFLNRLPPSRGKNAKARFLFVVKR